MEFFSLPGFDFFNFPLYPLKVKTFLKTFDSLDKFLILRGILCLMVIVYHSLPPRYFLHLGGLDLSWLIFANGAMAVWGFFLLSGYLIGKLFYLGKYDLDFKNLKQYFSSRARRIFPLYYFALLIFVLFAYSNLQFKNEWHHLASIITFSYDGTAPIAFNNAWWAISTEVQFYLIAPILFFLLKPILKLPKAAMGVAIFSLGLGFFIRAYFHSDFPKPEIIYQLLRVPLVQNFDIFLFGFSLFPLLSQFGNLKEKLSKYRLFSIPLFLVLFFASAYWWYREPIRTYTENVAYFSLLPIISLIILGIMFLMWEASNQPIGSDADKIGFSIFRRPFKLLEFFGLISYGVFVWHMAILQTEGSVFVYDKMHFYRYFLKTGLTIIFSLILATITYFLIEKPFLKKN